MFEDDPLKPKPRILADMSIEDLENLIKELEGRIEDCKAEIAKKQAVRKAASDLFGGTN